MLPAQGPVQAADVSYRVIHLVHQMHTAARDACRGLMVLEATWLRGCTLQTHTPCSISPCTPYSPCFDSPCFPLPSFVSPAPVAPLSPHPLTFSPSQG